MARLPKKTKKSPPGVSAKLLMYNTPNEQTRLSQYVRVLSKIESITTIGMPELFYRTKSKEPTTAAKPPILNTVVRWYPGTPENLWVHCSCEHFMYNCEYALTQYKASTIIYGNGNPAEVRNPRNIPFLCLTGDTLVRTPRGNVRLDSLKRGDLVSTLFGNRKVKASVMTGVKKSFTVDTKRGYQVKGSAQHPLLVFDTEKLDFVWKPISQIKVGDTLVHKLTTREKVKGSTPKQVRRAKLLGYMISDGCPRYFTQNDGLVKDDFLRLFRKEFDFIPSVKPDMVYIGVGPTKEFQAMGGFGQTSYDHYMPEWVYTAPDKVVRAFLCGLYSGDGCIHNTSNQITYATVSKRLALGLQDLLSGFGIRTSVTENVSGVNDSLVYLVRCSDYASTRLLLKILKNCDKYRVFRKTRDHNGSIIGTMPVPFERVMEKHVDEEFAKIKGSEKESIRSILEKLGVEPTETHISECVRTLQQTYPIPNGKYRSLKGSTIDEVKANYHKVRRALKLSLVKSGYNKDATNKNHAVEHLYSIPKRKTVDNWLALMTRQDITFETVTQIVAGREVEMFDIEVDKDHHFIANGLVVHNCKHLYRVIHDKGAVERLKRLYKKEQRKLGF